LCTTGKSSERVSGGSRNKVFLPGFNPGEIPGTFAYLVKETAAKINPDGKERYFSESSMRKIENLTKEATKTTTDKGCQNARRHQAMSDPYNFFALVIMLMVVYFSEPVDPRLSFNTDKSSSLLNSDTHMIILSAFGVKEELDDLNRNVSTTKGKNSEHKRRGIAYSTLTTSNGDLAALGLGLGASVQKNVPCVRGELMFVLMKIA